MPTVLRIKGFRFYFYSNESQEPMHIHIEKGDAAGKVWLEPIKVDYLEGFSKREAQQIMEIIKENVELIKNKWNEYFS